MTGLPVLAATVGRSGIVLPWFVPVALTLGIMGTRTGLALRHLSRGIRHDQSWWELILLAWMPALIWILVQFLPQY